MDVVTLLRESDPWSDSEDESPVAVRTLLKRRALRFRKHRIRQAPTADPAEAEPAEEPEAAEEEEEENEEGEEAGELESDSEGTSDSEESGEESGDEDEAEDPSSPTPEGPSPVQSSITDGDKPASSEVIDPAPTATSAPDGIPDENLSEVVTAFPQASSATDTAGLEPGNSQAIVPGDSSSGPKMSQAGAAGIAIGVIAFVTLIMAGAFFLWRRRRRAAEDAEAFDRYLAEKAMPPSTPDLVYDGTRAYPQRTQSDIMNQAIIAAYDADEANHPGIRISMESSVSQRLDQEQPPRPVSPMSPTGLRPPEQARVVDTQQNPNSLRLPVTAENLGIYPPGQIPLDKYRIASMAHTEVTATTESSWRTWNVNQAHAHKPKTWKEKYLS